MKFKTYCEFFEAIEADPTQPVADFTVRNMLEARWHLDDCKKCYESTERVLAKRKDKFKDDDEGPAVIGFNVN